MLQKAPDITVSSILHPTHVPAVVEFMKTTGLGYTGKLYGRNGREERREGSDGEGSERGEEGGGSDRGGVGEGDGDGEESAEGSDGEWKFGLFE
jgi:hypothetical protein